jgi:uncharacterized protein YkwD
LIGGWRYARRGAVGLALLLALPACTSARQEVTTIAVDPGRTAGLVSAYRSQNGLGPVSADSRLTQAAAVQARAMGERDRIGHGVGGPLTRRVSEAGYDWGVTAENLAAGQRSLDEAMADWRNSPDHRHNLLNPLVTDIGIAAVATPPGSNKQTYWALVLAAPRPEPVLAGPFAMGAVQ